MTHITSYITFRGNCREAMSFYKECFGGEIVFQTVGDSPQSANLPDYIKKYILHASLKNENIIIMGSDMVDEPGLISGNSVSLMLNCSSEDEVYSFYNKLCEGGIRSHPPQVNTRGVLFGGLTDKYNIHWLLNFNISI